MSEKSFRFFMFFWAVCFLIAGCIFILVPHTVTTFLRLPHEQSEYLWLALAGSMMMTISYLSYCAGKNPELLVCVKAVLICKCASSLLFIFFAWKLHNFFYLAGAAIDFPIFLFFLWAYKKRKAPCQEA